jgi:hypothetical protein
MNKQLILCVISLLLTSHALQAKPCAAKATELSEYQDNHPSYQCKNAFGKFDHCLRACFDLPAGVIVGLADFTKTDNEFIALHKSKEFRHVAIMGFKQNGLIQWGRVNGKMALVNHSCDPNCELTEQGNVVTIKQVKEAEELTIAYDVPVIGIAWNPQWNFKCLCNARNCRMHLDSYDWNKKPRQLGIIN